MKRIRHDAHVACKCLPPLTTLRFAELKNHIKVAGQQLPIMMYGDLIIDGRHRELACIELGREPIYQQWYPVSDVHEEIEKEIYLYVAGTLQSRDWTVIQKARLVQKWIDEEKIFDIRMKDDSPELVHRRKTQDDLARAAGISRKTLQRLNVIDARAEPELKTLVDTGRLGILTGHEISAEEPAVQREVSRRIKEGASPSKAVEAAKKVVAATKDGRGFHVPESYNEVFGMIPRFEELVDRARSLGESIKDLSQNPAGQAIILQNIQTDIANIARQLNGARPFCICPICAGEKIQGNGERCQCCRGGGWITKRLFEQLPEEMRTE